MLKKTRKFLVKQLKKLSPSTLTLLFSEVASVYKILKEKLISADPDDVMFTITSFFLMMTSFSLVGFMIYLFMYF